MKKILYLIAAGLICMFAPSCTDLLDLNPTTQPSEETFWKNDKDFDLALAGVYGQLRSQDYFNALYPMFDNLTDNSFDKNWTGSAQAMCLGEIDPTSDGYIPDIFDFCYSALARVNKLIEKAEASTAISAEKKKQVLGEAMFFRGFYHMWLYLFYGDVPVVTRSLTFDKQYLPKSTAEEVYTQVLTDYDAAIANLPDVTYRENGGHITKGGVTAFKAKIMLQHAYVKGVPNREELQAISALLDQISGYSLQPEYSDLFNAKQQEASPEIIFSVKNLAPSSGTGLDMMYTNWLQTSPLRNLVDEFELQGEGSWKGSAAAAAINEAVINSPDSPVYDQEKERAKLFIGRDKRLKATIFHSLKPFPDIRYIEGETDYTGFGCYKYLQYPANGDLLDGYVSEQDMILMRYGYILLMKAEVVNELDGPVQEVYDAVNAIRTRAGQNPLPAGLSKDEMRSRIRHEWRVETAMEGLHYLEMKRWHTLGDLVNISDPKYTTYHPSFQERFYLWPLPQAEIEKAKGILIQNPDYI